MPAPERDSWVLGGNICPARCRQYQGRSWVKCGGNDSEVRSLARCSVLGSRAESIHCFRVGRFPEAQLSFSFQNVKHFLSWGWMTRPPEAWAVFGGKRTKVCLSYVTQYSSSSSQDHPAGLSPTSSKLAPLLCVRKAGDSACLHLWEVSNPLWFCVTVLL